MKFPNDCLLIEEALAINSKMPLKQIYCSVVCTKNYFFIIPTKSVGMYIIFNSFKEHSFFKDTGIVEGLKKIIDENETTRDLENQLKELLEQNENYFFAFNDAKKWNIKGFLGKKTLTFWKKEKGHAGFSPKSKAEGKLLSAFYHQV